MENNLKTDPLYYKKKILKNEGKSKKIANAKVNFYANPFLSGALFVPEKDVGIFAVLFHATAGSICQPPSSVRVIIMFVKIGK